MPDCWLMVGIPGSGKSTLVKKITPMDNTEVISRDAIRFSIIDDKKGYFSKEQEVFKTYINEINSALDAGKNVIADATHISIASRRKVMSKVHTKSFFAIFVDTDLPICIFNNDQRSGLAHVPYTAIEDMAERLQPPSYNEGFEKIFIVKNGEFSEMKR